MRKRKFSDNLLFSGAKANRMFAKKQNLIKKRHHIEDCNVVVVEKSNMVKFLCRTTWELIRMAALISLFALSIIGAASLLYPEPRRELVVICVQTIEQLKKFLAV